MADESTGNLDSLSGLQVMDTLERLHRCGRTVIIVTHDSDVAARAQRRIHVADGVVREVLPVRDITEAQFAHENSSDVTGDEAQVSIIAQQGVAFRLRLWDCIGDAWDGLISGRRRTWALITAVRWEWG
ncbi:hypothetical protein [Actinomyces vulturis]|uniref:hypothetical protein n=1 Tax=Actinomyces vulturis TaxID=1857645 RepID=UPI00082DFD90|nr:hypothetical protein [Actinomyces vulturis]